MSAVPPVLGVIQARMGSTRLPGKLLAPLAGRPLLEWIVHRVRPARVDGWWLATTSNIEDDVAAEWGTALGLDVLRGDPDDVLSRFVSIARQERPEWLVRLTADNPFVDAVVVDELVHAAEHVPAPVQHVVPREPRSLPLGYAPEVVRAEALLILESEVLPPYHRAHVTSAIRERGGSAYWDPPAGWPRRPDWRWTVDTGDDLAMADAAFRAFGSAASSIDYPAMVDRLDRMPEITSRNAMVLQREPRDG